MSGSSGSNILQEFLVKVGWEVDGKTEEDVKTSIKRTAAYISLQAGLIEAAMLKAASSLEAFYFQSNRAGASVENLKAIGFAATQVGVGADQMRGAVESLASFMRSNPGAEGFLGSLGVRTRDANGKLRDTSDLLGDVGGRLGQMPFYQAKAYGSVLGIDERTLMALRQGLGGFAADYKRMAGEAGLDLQKAAEGSHAFMIQVRTLGAAVGILADKITEEWAGKASESVARMRGLLEQNFGRISKVIGAAASTFLVFLETLVSVGVRIAQVMAGVLDWWEKLSAGNRGLIAGFGALLVAWRLVNAGFLTSPFGVLMTTIASFLLLWDDYKVWKEGGISQIDWGPWDKSIQSAIDNIKWFAHKVDDAAQSIGGWKTALEGLATYIAGSWFMKASSSILQLIGMFEKGQSLTTGFLGSVGAGVYLGMTVGKNNSTSDLDSIPKNQYQTAKESWDFWKKQGATDSGAAAMVAQEQGESGFNKDAISPDGSTIGSFQWSKARREAIWKALHINIADKATTHLQMLQAMAWEVNGGDPGSAEAWPLIRDAATGQNGQALAVGLGVTKIERSKDQEKDIRRRFQFANTARMQFGSGPNKPFVTSNNNYSVLDPNAPSETPRLNDYGQAMQNMRLGNSPALRAAIKASDAAGSTGGATITQTNTFNITGTADPTATANRIASPLRTANSDIVRNLGGNVR